MIKINPNIQTYQLNSVDRKQTVQLYSYSENPQSIKNVQFAGVRSDAVKYLKDIKASLPHRVVVISGPSGVGKDTIIAKVREKISLKKAISYATRAPRPGEKNGVDYHFISDRQFGEMDAQGKFFQQLELNGNRYGGTLDEIDSQRKGNPVLQNMSAEEAHRVKKEYPKDSILIFVAPPSMEELRARLVKRGTETATSIAKRMEYATQQMECQSDFDKIIVNRDLEKAVKKVVSYIQSRRKLSQKVIDTLIALLDKKQK